MKTKKIDITLRVTVREMTDKEAKEQGLSPEEAEELHGAEIVGRDIAEAIASFVPDADDVLEGTDILAVITECEVVAVSDC